MKFHLVNVRRTIDEEVEINSLDELKALQEKHGDELIVSFDCPPDGRHRITIYDDYVE